jgi:hypothetical protein
MNRFRRSKTWLSLWLIVAVLGHFGLGHQDASAFVLCFGADGHVAVERAGHDHHSEAVLASPGTPSKAGTYVLKSGESPCVDIPGVSEDQGAHKPLSRLLEFSLDSALAALAAVVLMLIPIDELLTVPVFFPDPPVVDSRLPVLRSVILLI